MHGYGDLEGFRCLFFPLTYHSIRKPFLCLFSTQHGINYPTSVLSRRPYHTIATSHIKPIWYMYNMMKSQVHSERGIDREKTQGIDTSINKQSQLQRYKDKWKRKQRERERERRMNRVSHPPPSTPFPQAFLPSSFGPDYATWVLWVLNPLLLLTPVPRVRRQVTQEMIMSKTLAMPLMIAFNIPAIPFTMAMHIPPIARKTDLMQDITPPIFALPCGW